ncbi:MAG: hypothetical protein M1820_007783 [Bogoriella megaspora]|nr:MAG: hypothetical protein M1820_007783 [Bogoriella megaspora]
MAQNGSEQEAARSAALESPKRSFGPFNIVAAAFNICQAWAAVGATFVLGIAHGGSVGVVYGLVIMVVLYGAIALSMAELAARFPSSGGQYHWTALIAPSPIKKQLAVALSVSSFLAITVACLALAYPKQSSDFVWTDFLNETGWSSSGVAFLTGLININYGFAGLDGAVHLADECLNPATAVPWALVSAILASFATATVFMIAMLYCIQDFDQVLKTPMG